MAPKKDDPAAKSGGADAKKGDKAKSDKKQKTEKGAKDLYKVENDKVSRVRPTCERCGTGYFMADHHNRFTCGHCGFTRYKQK